MAAPRLRALSAMKASTPSLISVQAVKCFTGFPRVPANLASWEKVAPWGPGTPILEPSKDISRKPHALLGVSEGARRKWLICHVHHAAFRLVSRPLVTRRGQGTHYLGFPRFPFYLARF